MELLVSVALTLVIIGLVNTIFNSTTKAVTRGVQLGDVIANQRTMTEQLRVDSEDMLGPLDDPGGNALDPSDTPGMLAIVNYRVTRGGTIANPQVAMTNAERIGEETLIGQLRSDQLMFLKTNGNGGVVDTLAPSIRTSYAGVGNYVASHSLIWYGHGNRTNENGSPAGLLDDFSLTGLNRNPWQWVLARKELYLTDRPSAGGSVAGVIHVDGVAADSAVSGYSGTSGVTEENYSSLADVSQFALVADGAEEGFFDAAGTSGPGDSGTTNDQNYRTAAFQRMFLERNKRVQINDAPIVPYDSWRIAQMHPFFMQGVSDFIIEFAGDYHNDGTITGFPDGTPDLDYDSDGIADDSTATGSGDIVWYSMDNLPPIQAAGAFTNPAEAYATFIDTDPEGELGLAANAVAADAAFVWRHDKPASWPYIIRIRYRLHDGRGRLATTQDTNVNEDLQRTSPAVTYDAQPNGEVEPTVGRWFEIMIPVERTPQ